MKLNFSRFTIPNHLLLLICIYILPSVLSLAYSLGSGYLTGDHWHIRYSNPFRLANSYLVFWLILSLALSLLSILCRLRSLYRFSSTIWVHSLPTRLSALILIAFSLLIAYFGIVPVGAASPGPLATLISSLNPTYGILILVTLNSSSAILVLSVVTLLITSFKSHSLFPLLFILFIALYIHKDSVVIKLNKSRILLTTVFSAALVPILGSTSVSLLDFRNSLRGTENSLDLLASDPNANHFFGLLIGRIRSFSSLVFLRDLVETLPINFTTNVPLFYVFQRILSSFGLADLPQSFGMSFNDYIIGTQRDWGTIMSLPGYFILAYNQDISRAIVDLFSLVLLLAVLVSLAPPSNRYRYGFLLITAYQYLLSGDPFELISVIRSLLMWLILIGSLAKLFKYPVPTISGYK